MAIFDLKKHEEGLPIYITSNYSDSEKLSMYVVAPLSLWRHVLEVILFVQKLSDYTNINKWNKRNRSFSI